MERGGARRGTSHQRPNEKPPVAGAGAGVPNENPPNGAGCLASAGLLAVAAVESAPKAELKMSAAVDDGVLPGAAGFAAPNGVPKPKLLEAEPDPALG